MSDAQTTNLQLWQLQVDVENLAPRLRDNFLILDALITGRTAETSIDSLDLILLWDVSAGAFRKMTR